MSRILAPFWSFGYAVRGLAGLVPDPTGDDVAHRGLADRDAVIELGHDLRVRQPGLVQVQNRFNIRVRQFGAVVRFPDSVAEVVHLHLLWRSKHFLANAHAAFVIYTTTLYVLKGF